MFLKVFFAFILFFCLSLFLVSDSSSSSSSSSLSRTESPLHLFVSSHLHSHPKPDTFVWPPAAHSVSDAGPRREPSLCKHGFSFLVRPASICLMFYFLIIFRPVSWIRNSINLPEKRSCLFENPELLRAEGNVRFQTLVPKFQPSPKSKGDQEA